MKKAASLEIRCVAVVKTNASEESIASIIKVTRIDKLGTTLAIINNRSTKGGNTIEAHGVKSQKTAFFIVTAVKPSNLTTPNSDDNMRGNQYVLN
jgi:hypothetical protein